ncbi:catenin delta-2-like [Glandiceps talaboti]
MAAYVERITESKDSRIMADIRALGGVPAAVDLLGHPIPDIHHSAANILWNIAYRQPNDDNNLAIKNASGIPALVRLLRTTSDEDTKEITTGTLWNLSSDERLKIPILEDSMTVLVKTVLIPESGWDRSRENEVKTRNAQLSDIFTNATGCLRNVSSAGIEARKKMRECEGLVDSLLYVINSISDSKSNQVLDSRAVENTMCILQNLSYHISSEIFHREAPAATSRRKESNEISIGCFSFGKKSNRERHRPSIEEVSAQETRPRKEPPSGKSLLWQPDVSKPYFCLLSECSNIETLEAAAATVQNLTATDSKWNADIRTSVRKAKGLPILVELLKIDENAVVHSVAKALHNLCFDPRNKELVVKSGYCT